MSPERSHDLARLLRQAERRVAARLTAVLAEHGISVEQWHVLASLADGSGRAMSELGAAVAVPAPTMSKLVDGMVASNLVHRRVDVRDRRRVLVFLTPRGRRLHSQLDPVAAGCDRALSEQCGADGLDALRAALLAFVHCLDGPGRGQPAGLRPPARSGPG